MGACDGTILNYWTTEGETNIGFFVLYMIVMVYFFGGNVM